MAEYDVFLSHNSRDKPAVEALAASLGSSQVADTHGFNEVRLYREGQKRWLTVQHFERKGQSFDPVADRVDAPLTT